MILTISPSLPCGVMRPTSDNPYALCGRDATQAHADPNERAPGEYIILPICRECAEAMAEVYRER